MAFDSSSAVLEEPTGFDASTAIEEPGGGFDPASAQLEEPDPAPVAPQAVAAVQAGDAEGFWANIKQSAKGLVQVADVVRSGGVIQGVRDAEKTLAAAPNDLAQFIQGSAAERAANVVESYGPAADRAKARIVQREQEIQALGAQLSPEMQAFNTAEGGDALGLFLSNPVEVAANVIGSSLVSSIPSLVLGAAGSVGGPAGTAAGVGAGSFATEYAHKLVEELRQEADLTNPDALADVLANPETMERIRAKSVARGVPVAAFDALTGGLAGRFLKPALGGGTRAVLKASGKEVAMQSAGGGVGEVAGSVTAGDPISAKNVAIEMLAEVAGSPGEVAGNVLSARKASPQQQLVTQLKEVGATLTADTLAAPLSTDAQTAPATAAETTLATPAPEGSPQVASQPANPLAADAAAGNRIAPEPAPITGELPIAPESVVEPSLSEPSPETGSSASPPGTGEPAATAARVESLSAPLPSADTAPPATTASPVQIGEPARRRLNTLADKSGLGVALLRDPQKGLHDVVQTDAQAAYDYAIEQSRRDWDDQNYKRNFKKIADHIEKEWPNIKKAEPATPALPEAAAKTIANEAKPAAAAEIAVPKLRAGQKQGDLLGGSEDLTLMGEKVVEKPAAKTEQPSVTDTVSESVRAYGSVEAAHEHLQTQIEALAADPKAKADVTRLRAAQRKLEGVMEDEDRRERSAQHEEEMTGNHELIQSVRALGGLPIEGGKGSGATGELARVKESKKGAFLALFRKGAKSLDDLRENLTGHGFHFETPYDMLTAIEESLATGKKKFGTQFPENYQGGPGAMGPVEGGEMQSGGSTTGLKKAVVKDERIQRGLDDLPPAERQPEEARVQRAEDRVDADATLAPSIVSRIVDRGEHAVTPDDAAVLLIERTRLMNERKQWERESYNEEGNRALADEKLADIEAQTERLDRAQRLAGSSWGRVGHLYQRMMREDFTLEAMERRARKAKDAPLTSEERATLAKQAEEIKASQDKITEIEAENVKLTQDAEVIRGIEATIKELQEQEAARPKWGKEVFEVARTIVDRWQAEADAVDLDIKGFLGGESGGIGGVGGGPGGKKLSNAAARAAVERAFVTKVALKVRAKIGKFGLNFAETSAALIAEFGGGIQPYLKKAWVKAQGLIDSEKTNPKVKAAVKAGTKKGEKKPADIKARAKAEAQTGDELSNKTVGEAVRAHIAEGIHGEDALMKAAHETLKEAYPDITERDVRRAYSEYGKVKFPSKDAVKVEMAELRQLVKMQEDIDRMQKDNQAALRAGFQRPKATQAIRDKIKARNDLLKKREGAPSPEKLASRDEAKQTALRNRIEDLDRMLKTGEKTERAPGVPDSAAVEQLKAERDAMQEKWQEIEDAKTPPPSPAELQMEALAKIRDRLDETLSGKRDPKKPKDFDPLTAGAADIKMEIEAMKELAAQMRRDAKPKTDPGAAKEAATIKALEEAITRYSEKTAKADFSTKAKVHGPDTRRVAALKEVLDSRRSMYETAKKLSKPIRTAEERYNDTRMKNITRQMEEAKARIAEGKFAPKTKKIQPALNKAIEKARFELHKLKMTVRQGEFEAARKLRDKRTIAKDAIKEAFHTVRAILTGGELSGLLRQGKFSVVSHPFLVAKGPVPAMLKAFRSEAAEHAEMTRINERANAPEYQQSGLAIHDPASFTAAQLEGNYRSRTANRIPLIAGSGRAYTMFLNRLRADVYDALKANFESVEGRSMTPGEMKNVATFINEQTGSGSLGVHGQKAVGFLNAVYFAPKFTVSRFQMLFGHSLWEKNSTWATRKLIIKEYARIGAGLAVMYALYKLGLGDDEPIETDPRSGVSGTIKSGKSRLDPMAGELQAARLVARAVTGETKGPDGTIKSLIRSEEKRVKFGARNMKDVLFDFNRSKMSPVAGAAMDEILREDYQGNALTWKTRMSHLAPITYQQIYQTMTEDENVPKAAAMSVLGFLGEGIRTEQEWKK